MKSLKIFLIFSLIFFLILNNGIAQDNKFYINIGIKIHGHIEPTISFSLNLEEFELILKTGIIYDKGIFILVPGIFIGNNIGNFQPYSGLEGFFLLNGSKYLLLFRIGGVFYFTINNYSFGIGGEIGIPINYNFKFIPTLILNFRF